MNQIILNAIEERKLLIDVASEFLPKTAEEYKRMLEIYFYANQDLHDISCQKQMLFQDIDDAWDNLTRFSTLINFNLVTNLISKKIKKTFDETRNLLLENEYDACLLTFEVLDRYYKDSYFTMNLAIDYFVRINQFKSENFKIFMKSAVRSLLPTVKN